MGEVITPVLAKLVRREDLTTDEVVEVATHKILTTLEDEQGRHVASEKLLELDFKGGQPVRHGDQFGLGRVR